MREPARAIQLQCLRETRKHTETHATDGRRSKCFRGRMGNKLNFKRRVL